MVNGQICELRFEDRKMRVAERGRQSGLPDLQGEKILQNNLQFLLDEDAEIYEGYGRRYGAFPYRQYNGYSRELKEKTVRTAILENTCLEAVFLPEYGGRLWSLTDKRTGRNLLYTNDVIRFSNLAVRNAWFSGGVEWNMGVIGHSPLTVEPLYVAEAETEKGLPVLRMYEYERIRGVVYQMDFWLEEDESCLNCRMRIVNESSEILPMYWWSNMAVPEYEEGHVVVPADTSFTFEDGKVTKVDIPYVNGIDITDYCKIPASVDYFFDIQEHEVKYIANVDKSGYGLLQMSSGRLKGRKLFSWGNGQASDHWQEFLTENAGRYVEIQAGLGKTQYGCVPMAPHTAWEWLETYGPVQMTEEQLSQEHKDRSAALTLQLREKGTAEALERRLRETKAMAKTSARLIKTGSAYGTWREGSESTKHLEFQNHSKSLLRWERFLVSGVLHEPEPKEEPDEFLNDREDIFRKLKATITSQNKGNWYAHYQLATCFYIRKRYKRAKTELKKSLKYKKNAWAYHELASVYLVCGKNRDREKAVKYLLKGMKLRTGDTAYLKEGFKLLFQCEAYQELNDFYQKLKKPTADISRLRFYYIYSLHKLGEHKKALKLLEKDGGLVMEDIREGEDSVSQLWVQLQKSIFGSCGKLPYQYDFKAY